jgi:hypothetical protein
MELKEAKNKLNLLVLQRYDQHILRIVETASHVVLYDFDDGGWVPSSVNVRYGCKEVD